MATTSDIDALKMHLKAIWMDGPATRAFATLGDAEQAALRADLVNLWTSHNQASEPARTVVDAEAPSRSWAFGRE